jgi:hypothetical protein
LFIAQKRFETKHQDEITKRDALRDMLVILPVVFRDIHLNWEMPKDSKESSKEHIDNLVKKITRWKALFINDSETLATIQKLDLLIGMSKDSFFGRDNENVKKPGERIEEIETEIKEKIKQIEKSLT